MNTKQTRQDDLAVIEAELGPVLGGFRENVKSWSEGTCSSLRAEIYTPSAHWKRALGWAVGCAVSVVGVAGVVQIQHHGSSSSVEPQIAMSEKVAEVEPVPLVPQRAPEPTRIERPRQQAHPEDWMAKVDSDVSRQIPEVLEPLAQWTTDDGEQ